MRQAGTQPLFGKFYRINRLFKFKIQENIGIFCQNIASLQEKNFKKIKKFLLLLIKNFDFVNCFTVQIPEYILFIRNIGGFLGVFKRGHLLVHLRYCKVLSGPVYMEWGTPVQWGRFLLFCVPQSVKTKETNPTRPGSPTPCKQALNLVYQSMHDWLQTDRASYGCNDGPIACSIIVHPGGQTLFTLNYGCGISK